MRAHKYELGMVYVNYVSSCEGSKIRARYGLCELCE